MSSLGLTIELLSPWHVSSGRGGGPTADATLVRSPAGLPMLPGRTLRGLLRDGCRCAEDLERMQKGRTEALFGTWTHGGEPRRDRSRRDTTPGLLVVHSAHLPREFEAFAARNPEWAAAFTTTVSATALDDSGIAMDHCLRTVEVAVPLTLEARLEGPEDHPWSETIAHGLPWIRGLGLMRSRGYGRCRLTLEGEEEDNA